MTFETFTAPFTKAFSAWQKMGEESLQRTNAFYAELDKMDAKGREKAAVAIDESAKLAKETLAYGAELGAEWRKLTLDAVKRAGTMFETTPAAEVATK